MVDPRLQKFKESFESLNGLLDAFKNSKGSDLPKDLKFYRSVYGKVVTPALNNAMLTVHGMQEQLNSSFLPKKYPSGNLKVFNNHQLEMIDTFLDPNYKIPEESAVQVNAVKPVRNKFLELQQNSSGNKNVIKPKTNKTFVREIHPHAELIKNMKLPIKEMFEEDFDEAKFLERTLKNVPLNWIDSEEALKEMFVKLEGEKIIAVDLEHHSFHSYTGLVSLIQISSSKEDFLIDPIKLREPLQSAEFSLNRIFANEKILKIFHGAESDIAWLQRDFDTFVVNMFDSFHAAKVLNLPRMSLAYLLEQFCGVELDKKYQLADWRERPMPEEMIEYARKDTHYLVHLYFLLKRKLTEKQYEQVLEKSNEQCLELYAPEPLNEKSWKVALNRSNYPLNGEQVNVVRRLFYWREWKAKELDVSPPALMPNSYLTKIAHFKVKSVPELKDILRNVSELMMKEFPALIEFLLSDESKESEFYEIKSENVETATANETVPENSHIRFEEPVEAKKVKLEPVPVVKRVSKVSFVSAATASGVSLFQSTNSSVNGKVLLADLVRESLPKIQPEEFKTREKEAAEREAAERVAKEAEEAKKEEEEVKAVVHGSNRVVENLEIVAGGSNSTVLADKLRKSAHKKSQTTNADDIIHFDYTVKEPKETDDTEEVKVFDPYNTIKTEKKKAFIEATIAPETGPRLSANRMSGNRMASFTKKLCAFTLEMRLTPICKRVISSRRKAFGFEKLNYEESVVLPSEKGPVTVPLEAHAIGNHGPSLIPFDESLLEILACPISGEPLKFDREKNFLVSEATGYAFPINKAGMPIFLKKWAIKIRE